MLSSSRLVAAGFIAALYSLVAVAGCGGGGAGSSSTTIPQTSAAAPLRSAQGFAPPLGGGMTLFADDFEDGSTAAWTPRIGSTWSICQPPGESREYCTPGNTKGTDALATAGSAAWTNYEVDAWTVPGSTSTGGVELVGRYVDANHFYELELRTAYGHQIWSIYKNVNSTWTQLASGPASYTGGRYYHLRLVLNGATLSAYATINANDWNLSTEKQLWTGSDAAYAAGAIAVRAIYGIPARFDNVGVYALSAPSPSPSPSQAPPANPALTVPSGFYVQVIAQVRGARQLAAASNGDLLVGTQGTSIAIVPNAESDGVASAPQTLSTLPEIPAQGIGLGPNGTLYAATNTGVWRIPYTPGTLSAPPATKIAAIRTGAIAPGSDGDVHFTSAVVVSGTTVYVGVGSSCNACAEVDPTRASVQAMNLDGSGMHTYATRIRNPMAFTVDPATGMVFTGGAGQDGLRQGHPYEYLDGLTAHRAVADYGWPGCEENHVAYIAGSDCTNTVQPIIEFPAYSTIEGAAYYPATTSGTYAFPAAFRGGIFVSMHGSWHSTAGGIPIDGPHVAFVAMKGDLPAKWVNWSDPTAQWTEFFTGFQDASGSRIGKTTGIAVGSRGSLFVADDQSDNIYRIRPGLRP